MDKNYFLYLAIGEMRYKYEAIYSIVSLYRVCRMKYCIVLFTDDVSFVLENLKKEDGLLEHIDIIDVNYEKLLQWTNGKEFMYRAKICAIKEFFEQYEGNMIFLDTDIIVLSDITEYFDCLGEKVLLNFERKMVGESVKYINDFKSPAYITTTKLMKGIKYCDGEIKVGKEWTPYNSGIIGMRDNGELINRILICADAIYNIAEYNTSEELAFSYILQKVMPVQEVKKEVIHYYVKKETRIFAGYCLDYLLSDDTNILQKKLEETKIGSISKYGINLSQCEYFLNYIDYFKLKRESYLWDSPEAQFYSKTEDLLREKRKNIRMYKSWFSIELRNK